MPETPQFEAPKKLDENVAVARVLGQIAEMLEFKDENAFKVRSYRMAAETIESMHESINEIAARGVAELQKIEGIGKGISAQIAEIVERGKSTYLESLTQDVPITVLDLRRVSGIGLKTAQTLYRDFAVKDLPSLRTFAQGGGLLSVPGIGEKSVARVLKSLERISTQERPTS
ncbi:MAG TPA: helix-hairpin-helix domain-containing protein [Blastocatellia bacterium]|nr:helix-hairpin-helix domain-containing protein [Blastocatellia bacterium]